VEEWMELDRREGVVFQVRKKVVGALLLCI
jgi:hypothetical protein